MKTEFKHTPGSWKYYPPKNFQGNEVRVVDKTDDRFTKLICQMSHYPDSSHENEANAKLIAAAPELLEALKDVMSVIRAGITNKEDQKVFDNSQSIKKALAAIKKATS